MNVLRKAAEVLKPRVVSPQPTMQVPAPPSLVTARQVLRGSLHTQSGLQPAEGLFLAVALDSVLAGRTPVSSAASHELIRRFSGWMRPQSRLKAQREATESIARAPDHFTDADIEAVSRALYPALTPPIAKTARQYLGTSIDDTLHGFRPTGAAERTLVEDGTRLVTFVRQDYRDASGAIATELTSFKNLVNERMSRAVRLPSGLELLEDPKTKRVTSLRTDGVLVGAGKAEPHATSLIEVQGRRLVQPPAHVVEQTETAMKLLGRPLDEIIKERGLVLRDGVETLDPARQVTTTITNYNTGGVLPGPGGRMVTLRDPESTVHTLELHGMTLTANRSFRVSEATIGDSTFWASGGRLAGRRYEIADVRPRIVTENINPFGWVEEQRVAMGQSH